MLKVYAKATFALGKPGDLERPLHVIHAGVIDANVPEWAENELTFKNGVKAGLIEIITTREAEIRAEHEAADTETAAKSRGRKKAVDAV